jgi:pimeloyl-ACP methyl ester carboxylesterase
MLCRTASDNEGEHAMPFYENGATRIHYEETGSGFPLLIIPGGGLNASIAGLATHDFNPLEEFQDTHRCIAIDPRNSNGGDSSGPLEVDRPWDAHADDQIGLMDHLGIDKFMVMGFCIGGPFIWNLLSKISDRIVAAVLVHPSGYNPDAPGYFHKMNSEKWGPPLIERRPDITKEMVNAFLTTMYPKGSDFVFTVDRDFVGACETPILILPDDIPPHPYAMAMETARLAPNAQASLFPWRTSPETIAMALRHINTFLAAHRMAEEMG